MPIFYPSDHPSTIVRPEERHRSPSARKDELQGRARKSECPKRSVATQVFRISASAARLSAWVTVALTFFCLLFLCQDKKRRWGPVGASPPPKTRQAPDLGSSCFSSVRVGCKSIRPPQRPRQRDERKTCIRHRRWRLEGVCDTPLQPGTSMELQNAIPFPP